jgi:hypothetical protein
MTSKLKKIIIAIVVLVLVYFGYSMFFKKSSDNGQLISGTRNLAGTNYSETQQLGSQITAALIQIESLNLDRSIFQNPIYRSLLDRSEPISPEPSGRRNPFAPLSDTSVNFESGVELDFAEEVEEQTDGDETTDEEGGEETDTGGTDFLEL